MVAMALTLETLASIFSERASGEESSSVLVLAISGLAKESSRALYPSETWFLGCECGRVFPAGVGPGSPSRDVVN